MFFARQMPCRLWCLLHLLLMRGIYDGFELHYEVALLLAGGIDESFYRDYFMSAGIGMSNPNMRFTSASIFGLCLCCKVSM